MAKLYFLVFKKFFNYFLRTRIRNIILRNSFMSFKIGIAYIIKLPPFFPPTFSHVYASKAIQKKELFLF